MGNLSLQSQLAAFLDGSEFGDKNLEARMRHELEERLQQTALEKRPLRVYCGYDVSGPDLHLGHTVTLRKLHQFQDRGHDVTLVVGTFTSLIGDPSERETARQPRSVALIMEESKRYAQQAFKILDAQKTRLRFNHEWLNDLQVSDFIPIAAQFSFQQLLSRENFRKRIEKGDTVRFQEILYPVVQAYDAVELRADVQLGATEQLFNLMTGRKLQEYFGLPPQICLTFPILVGIDGEKRMSKSTGNYIGINETPIEKYRKLFQLPPKALPSYIRLLTRWSPDEKNKMISAFQKQTRDPNEIRRKVACEIIAGIDGEEAVDDMLNSKIEPF
ncbi:MAG TPA: tyrosine--tRNA ligase [Anaerolineaceae bacterium]|jgi:tyrosyl-tRNA synthetase|nr:tyrosine--tRNA ligase [Anaerolineaceae bacterium]